MNQERPMVEDESDEILRAARESHRREAFQEVEERMRRSLEGFRRDLAAHPTCRDSSGAANAGWRCNCT